jgi:hypothetical protein
MSLLTVNLGHTHHDCNGHLFLFPIRFTVLCNGNYPAYIELPYIGISVISRYFDFFHKSEIVLRSAGYG